MTYHYTNILRCFSVLIGETPNCRVGLMISTETHNWPRCRGLEIRMPTCKQNIIPHSILQRFQPIKKLLANSQHLKKDGSIFSTSITPGKLTNNFYVVSGRKGRRFGKCSGRKGVSNQNTLYKTHKVINVRKSRWYR